MTKRTSILFLTLRTFSATGGLEKVCRVGGKALFEISEGYGGNFCLHSLHDGADDANGNPYIPEKKFRGFNGNIKKFIFSNLFLKAEKDQIIILSHVNLLIVGFLFKLLHPKSRLFLFGHGIEIWPRLSILKRMMLKKVDIILAVSNYTKERIKATNDCKDSQIKVLNNCLDPFLPEADVNNLETLKSRYHLDMNDKVILAVTRYSSKEKYKGYDYVIKALHGLRNSTPAIKYLLVGKYDIEERERIELMAKRLALSDNILFTGFVPDRELADHFKLADAFVMPSEKEGFGIVFIEAMYYDLPVIAGNKDGSVDALMNGDLGLLVDPENIIDLQNCIRKVLFDNYPPPSNTILLNNFSYSNYKNRLEDLLQIKMAK